MIEKSLSLKHVLLGSFSQELVDEEIRVNSDVLRSSVFANSVLM
jgi:hypothetical protein